MLLNAFVHIIESPSSNDLLNGDTQGRVLDEAFRLAGIPSKYNLVTNLETFKEALSTRLDSACSELEGFPILHFVMHGDAEGIQLTNGEDITWKDLNKLITPYKKYMGGWSIICMSTCEGYYAKSMDENIDNVPPLFALIGNTSKIEYSDAAVAYITFYHLLFKGIDIGHCVESMKVASGDENFVLINGLEIKTSYMEYIEKQISSIRKRKIFFMSDY
jgi:hypothetical protein